MAEENGAKPDELYLIDGNSLAYRAFFALPESIATSTGFPTNAIFGFASMLVKMLTEHGTKPTIVVWDAGSSGRKDISADYKATRTSRPDLLVQQWPHLEPLVEAFGYQNVSVEGYEADDVIATIAVRAREEGIPVTIVTGDRDAFQLIDPESRIKVMATARGITDTKLYDHQAVIDRYGIAPEDLFFDPLVLPVSTGMESDRRSALETIEGVRRIAARFPESQTVVGLSNVSFGLNPAARVVLNSAFLHELRGAGLTAAIVHASKILPQNRIPDEQWNAALDLIHDRRREGFDPLQAFIALFKDAASPTATPSKPKPVDMPLEVRLRAHIIDGEKQGLTEALDEALTRYSPLDIINDHLLDGMKTVGELFGSGRMQLPFVLQSAEVMKLAVSHLEPRMERLAGATKGRIVLATVKGDVHDIGKNLVDIILSNNGYTVHNLGIKQPIHDIVKAWRQHNADAIGLSGLLVKSVNVMEENLRELNAEGITVPVLLGGAALTRHYCEGHLRPLYKGKVFYGKDAFDGLRIMEHLVAGRTTTLDHEIDDRISKRSRAEELITRSRAERAQRMAEASSPSPREGAGGRAGIAEAAESPGRAAGTRAPTCCAVHANHKPEGAITPAASVPTPPFWGTRIVDAIDIDDIYPFVNTVALFRGQWQFKKAAMSDAEYERLLDDVVHPLFTRLKDQYRAILEPKVVYGYFPCNGDGDDLVIYSPSPSEGAGGRANAQPDGPIVRPDPDGFLEVARFSFPRQPDRQRLCISDFFRPIASGQTDVVAMHCVTMGRRVSEIARKLFESNDYAEYLYVHGLGVECAEALAELWHKRIRQELGIAGADSPHIRELFTQHYQGSRYSFGYPACPNMADQEKLWALVQPDRIGCTLTENHQIDPEQSTSAIIVHHPQAKYFNV